MTGMVFHNPNMIVEGDVQSQYKHCVCFCYHNLYIILDLGPLSERDTSGLSQGRSLMTTLTLFQHVCWLILRFHVTT